MEIRLYRADDEPAVRRLSARLSEGFAPWRDPEAVARTIDTWIDDALSEKSQAADDRAVLVAVAPDGAVIGFAGVAAQDHYISGRDGYLGELVVSEDAQGRGVGRALLAAVERWATDHGCERLTLQTGAANDRARRFYERLGFAYEDVSMARPLDSR